MAIKIKRNLWWIISSIVLAIPIVLFINQLSIKLGEKLLIGIVSYLILLVICAIVGIIANKIRKVLLKIIWIILGFIGTLFYILFVCMAMLPVTDEDIYALQQYSVKRHYDKTIKTIKRELFLNDTTWRYDRFESTLTRDISIYSPSLEKMDNVVSVLNRNYSLIYYGTRKPVFDAYNYPERCSYDQLLRLPREFLGYATDFYKVAIFEYETSLILIGYTTDRIVIFEPYLYLYR